MMKLDKNADHHADGEAPNEIVLTRRTLLRGALAAALTPVSGLLTPASAQTIKQAAEIGGVLGGINMCRVATSTIQGPYYIDKSIVRSDIRENQAGVPLELEFRLVNANGGCGPIAGALVSIWHCNAEGEYSGYLFNDPNVMPVMSAADKNGAVKEQDSERWLRGAQVTDADGKVKFRTIVPGWYTPRAPHIHLRAFLNQSTMVMTQLYFPQSLNNTIQSTHPAYKARGVSIYTNENDILLRPEDVLKVAAKGDGSLSASMTVGAGYV